MAPKRMNEEEARRYHVAAQERYKAAHPERVKDQALRRTLKNFGMTVLAILVALFVWFVLLPDNATSQAPAPESSTLVSACSVAKDVGDVNGFVVVQCRRIAPVGLAHNYAVETIQVKGADGTKVRLSINLRRSEWSTTAIKVLP